MSLNLSSFIYVLWQTNELQDISFKIGDYKYKGSEVDRKFSINNLQKILHQQEAARKINR